MEADPKRLIFCLSPGRCGTGYLAMILDYAVPGVTARHEPEPRFSEAEPSRAWWLREKLPAIEREPGDIYVETSHCFAHGFLEPLLEVRRPGLIAIRREVRAVALSFWRRRSVPARTARGREFCLAPDAPGWQEWTDYQLCYWHALEVDRRAGLVEKEGCPVHGIDFPDLFTEDGFAGLVGALALPEPDWKRYKERQTWRVNANPRGYYDLWPDGDLEEQEDEVVRALVR